MMPLGSGGELGKARDHTFASISLTLLNQFGSWLSIRKQQWRMERRKRKRQRVELPAILREEGATSGDDAANDPNSCPVNSNKYYDEILEDEEEHRPKGGESLTHSTQPMDISWLFDSQYGAPDECIYNIMTYLPPSDHGNLCCISYTSNFLFKQRNVMWTLLCPKRWIIPRRPRKSLQKFYITKIREEEETSRKCSDDLLVKANLVMEKGDQLHKLEKIILKAKDFKVDYVSGIVLERNSLLNLAVIDKRHKIMKWLIEERGADLESCDRGQFTPLMNAAWNGDKYVVRYLLRRGCDRNKLGYNHSSQGLAPATFEGFNAEGWARKQGHNDVAELIRLGL